MPVPLPSAAWILDGSPAPAGGGGTWLALSGACNWTRAAEVPSARALAIPRGCTASAPHSLGLGGVELIDFFCSTPPDRVPTYSRIKLKAFIAEFGTPRMSCPQGRLGLRRQRDARPRFGEAVMSGTPNCMFLN